MNKTKKITPLPAPIDFRKLDFNKQLVAFQKMLFWKILNEPMVLNGKLSNSYWKTRAFFNKQKTTTLNLLYDFMYQYEENNKTTISRLFTIAEKWNNDQRTTVSTDTTKTEHYESLLDCLKGWKE